MKSATGIEYLRLEKSSDYEIHYFLQALRDRVESEGERVAIAIEKLRNMAPPRVTYDNKSGMSRRSPGRGSKANWSLSGSYHGLRMALTCNGLGYVEVAAYRWQSYLNCRTGGKKKVSQNRAIELYPEQERIYQWQADALLLAHYAELYVGPAIYFDNE